MAAHKYTIINRDGVWCFQEHEFDTPWEAETFLLMDAEKYLEDGEYNSEQFYEEAHCKYLIIPKIKH